ncbi:MAG: hypothetical protein KBH41_20420 [Azonexus sp.]|nr:hypothetical protein [Azonexus sp.]
MVRPQSSPQQADVDLAVEITQLVSGEQRVAATAVLADAMLDNPLHAQAFGARDKALPVHFRSKETNGAIIAAKGFKALKQRLAIVQDSGTGIELDPDYVPAYTQLSNALIDLGRKEEAKAVLASGVEAAARAGDKHAAGKMGDKLKLLE